MFYLKEFFMTGKNVGKIIKIWSSLFLTEILLNWSCLSGVYAVWQTASPVCREIQAWETQARAFSWAKQRKTSRYVILCFCPDSLAGYGNHLLLPPELRKLAIDSPLVVGAAFQTDYHPKNEDKICEALDIFGILVFQTRNKLMEQWPLHMK